MLTKEQFLASAAHEMRVMRHLATKVKPGTHDWRPTPKQRSTRELMQYLTRCGIVPALAMVRGNWDHAEAFVKESEAVTPETFSAAMDRQEKALADLVSKVGDREFHERGATLPWGAPARLGEALVNTVLKALTAYRMQFFLYAKESGNPDIASANCWVGVDPPKRA